MKIINAIKINTKLNLFKKFVEDKKVDHLTLFYLQDIETKMYVFVSFMLKTFLSLTF